MNSSERRTGTLTLSLGLMIFGVFFILNKLFPALSMEYLITYWPVILILLGIEILVSYFVSDKSLVKYDGYAIFLIILLVMFSFALASFEQFVIQGKIRIS